MPQVLLVNPSARPSQRPSAKRVSTPKRKSAKKGSGTMATAKRKKARTPAQKAATRRMIAANKSKRKAPAKKSYTKKATKRVLKSAAPKRKRRKASWSITPTAVATRAGRQLRYRRPNPIKGIGNFVSNTLVPSAIGGAGALAVDVAMAMAPLPVAMKTGPMRPVVKIAAAVALGMIAGKVTSRRTGEQVAAGAITVTLYELARTMVAKTGVAIPGLSEYVSAYPDMGGGSDAPMPALGYVDSGMQVGEYVQGYETGVYR